MIIASLTEVKYFNFKASANKPTAIVNPPTSKAPLAQSGKEFQALPIPSIKPEKTSTVLRTTSVRFRRIGVNGIRNLLNNCPPATSKA